MNPILDLSQFIANQGNYGYNQMLFDADHYTDAHGFLASKQMIFGASSSGTANLWDNQQRNVAPTLLASPYINPQITDSVTQ